MNNVASNLILITFMKPLFSNYTPMSMFLKRSMNNGVSEVLKGVLTDLQRNDFFFREAFGLRKSVRY